MSDFSAVVFARQPRSETAVARLVSIHGKINFGPSGQRSNPELELKAAVSGDSLQLKISL